LQDDTTLALSTTSTITQSNHGIRSSGRPTALSVLCLIPWFSDHFPLSVDAVTRHISDFVGAGGSPNDELALGSTLTNNTLRHNQRTIGIGIDNY
jgi:hypothetical protein